MDLVDQLHENQFTLGRTHCVAKILEASTSTILLKLFDLVKGSNSISRREVEVGDVFRGNFKEGST